MSEIGNERDPVGLGIVGLGRWADAHAGAAARSADVRFVNGHARSEASRERFSDRHGFSAGASTFDGLLADPAVEAVVISTPNDQHVAQTLRCLDSGTPVLVDKPVAVDIAEGLTLLRAVRSTGVAVGVAHHARRLAGIRGASEWIRRSAGRVRLATADFSNDRSAHMRPDAWHRTARGSEAGALIQVGIHQVDNVIALLGPPQSVSATFRHETLGPMCDLAAVTIVHAGGGVSVVTTSWTTPGHFALDLLATGGNLRYELDHGHWTSGDVDDHGRLRTAEAGGRWTDRDVPAGDPLVEQLEELGRAARGDGDMAVDVLAGLRAVSVVEAAVRSAQAGGASVTIGDLATEAGATEAEIRQLVVG